MHAAVEHRHRDDDRQYQQECGSVEEAHLQSREDKIVVPNNAGDHAIVAVARPAERADLDAVHVRRHGEIEDELVPFVSAVWEWICVDEARGFIACRDIDERTGGSL